MLNQIIVTWSFVPRRCHEFSHGIELVIARKNHCFNDDSFLTAFAIVDFLFLFLREHEMAEHVEEAVTLQHLLREIPAATMGRLLWFALPAFHFTGISAVMEVKYMALSMSHWPRKVNLTRRSREKGAPRNQNRLRSNSHPIP